MRNVRHISEETLGRFCYSFEYIFDAIPWGIFYKGIHEGISEEIHYWFSKKILWKFSGGICTLISEEIFVGISEEIHGAILEPIHATLSKSIVWKLLKESWGFWKKPALNS